MASKTDFLDQARIFVAGGDGGNGAVHFRREKFVPWGGPDGGDGGDGGNVILEADPGLNTLFHFRHRRRFQAGSGSSGGPNRRHGKRGPDVLVPVPVGTVVVNADDGSQIADIARRGEKILVAPGGKGGLGNRHFATSTRQAPAFAEKGQPGKARWLDLELRLVADAGLVGLPNAGKSTLLAAMSAARPTIGDYPFTTLVPNLGVVAWDDYSFVLADIPGLIEGAHGGRGLGDQFLRHVERSRVLVHVIDGTAADPIADLDQVSEELRLYDAALLDRARVVALTKLDLPQAREKAEHFRRLLQTHDLEALAVSGVTGEGIEHLITAIRRRLENQPKEAPHRAAEQHVFTERPDPNSVTIERRRGTLVVRGETAERLVAMTDLESEEAMAHLQRRLRRLGVLGALERAGVRPGNRVRIGEIDLTWESEGAAGEPRSSERRDSGNRRRTGPGTRAYRGRHRG